jgi:hypothetical protein
VAAGHFETSYSIRMGIRVPLADIEQGKLVFRERGELRLESRIDRIGSIN